MNTPIAMDHVAATLNYLPDAEQKPVVHQEVPGGSPQQRNVEFQPRVVPVRNARHAGRTFDLDRQGFSLLRHESAVADF